MDAQPSRTSLWPLAALAGLTILPLLLRSREAMRRSRGAKWIDVSTDLDAHRTPVYLGNPPLKIEWTSTIRQDGVNLSRYSMGSHTGTHVDAPLHFIPNGTPIDKVDLRKLMGRARVIDIGPEEPLITAAVLNQHAWKGAPRILFKTRNSVMRLLETPTFHRNYVGVAPDAAALLASSGVEMVGVDYLSVQPFGDDTATHTILLGKQILVVEGLNLREVVAGDYDLLVLPLKVRGRDAAPARALLRRLS